MPAANRQPQLPEEPSGRPRMSKSQKRLLIVVGAVLLLAVIGWLIDALAPMPKTSSAGVPPISVAVAHVAASHSLDISRYSELLGELGADGVQLGEEGQVERTFQERRTG